MTITINERVVIRLLNAAARLYEDLPVERPAEAKEFRQALDMVIAIIEARPVHRAATGIDPVIDQPPKLKMIPGKARRTERKGPATAPTVPSHGSAERQTA
ncbi:hypothetical protein [Rhizobium leguminosarum]|uniref:hypothetical protein n=1 Tax=Rhizobium leguminosarum TaxID=384 RepID=UPI001C97C3F4|nr:hypothetical protein [Rhizobium leguminosarum]MBY5797774.1 hypothetical protein [Rhizobium leguminosarum]